MAESTLSLKCSDLIKAVAYYYGKGFAIPTDADVLAFFLEMVKTGLRDFYSRYTWSFLNKQVTLTTGASGTSTAGTGSTLTDTVNAPFTTGMVGGTVTFTTSENTYVISSVTSTSVVVLAEALETDDQGAGKVFAVTRYGVVDLPDDFEAMLGRITFVTDVGYSSLAKKTGQAIRLEWQNGLLSYGRPFFYAIQSKSHTSATATVGQRSELLLAPIPDQSYTLLCPYRAYPDSIVYTVSPAVDTYPPGGMLHAETIKAACLAAIELHAPADDGLGNSKKEMYEKLLAASIARDVVNAAPDTFGTNIDRSDEVSGLCRHDNGTVTVET